MAPIEDRARALQLALAQGSWDDGVVLIAAALCEERRESTHEVRGELLALLDDRIEYSKENSAAISKFDKVEARARLLAALYLEEVRLLFSGWPKNAPAFAALAYQDDITLPTAEDARGILK